MVLTTEEGILAIRDIPSLNELLPVMTDDSNLGQSNHLGLPTTSELAQMLVRKLPRDLATAYATLPSLSIPYMADQYVSYFGLNSLLQFLGECFGNTNARPSHIQELVLGLPFQTFITTSVGHGLLNGLKITKITDIRTCVFADDLQGIGARQSLLKVFGCISRRDSVVFTRQHIERLKQGIPNSLVRPIRDGAALRPLLIVSPDLEGWQLHTLHELLHPIDTWSPPRYILCAGVKSHEVQLWENRGYRLIIANIVSFLHALRPLFEHGAVDLSIDAIGNPAGGQNHLPGEPYKFLDYFSAEDSMIFFGREQELTAALVNACTMSWSLVTGDSGLGKTSILRAGLIPKLEQRGSLAIYVRMLDEPMLQLATAIRGINETELLRQDASATDSLSEPREVIHQFVSTCKDQNKPVVVILDQFEEVFVRMGLGSRQALICEFETLSKSFANLKIVVSVRSDYLHRVLETSLGANITMSSIAVLKRFTTTQAFNAIMGPARLYGVQIDDGVVSRILKDLDKDGIEPAQLSIVCFSLYQACQGEKHITLDSYDQMGGTQGILGEYLDRVLNDLVSQNQREIAKAILKVLVSEDKTRFAVTVREVGRDYLVRSLRADAAEIEDVINFLVRQRIVRYISERTDFLELSHETLVHRIWQWITELDIERKFTRSLLHRAISDWRQFEILPRREHWETISRLKTELEFDDEEILLMLKASLAFGEDVNYWVLRADHGGLNIAKEFEATMNGSEPDAMLNALLWAVDNNSAVAVQVIEAGQKSSFPALQRRAARHIKASVSSGMNGQPLMLIRDTDFIRILAGKFLMGIDDERFPYSGPAHEVFLDEYRIQRYPITNLEYHCYVVDVRGRPPKHWIGGNVPDALLDHPVTNISWFEACAYCLWLGRKQNSAYRLPSAAEWEKAAGWDERKGRRYLWSWGDIFDPERANTRVSGPGRTTPIGQYSSKGGDSVSGVSDMCGNTFDWVLDWSTPLYIIEKDAARNPRGPKEGIQKVARGGSWAGSPEGASVVANSYALLPGMRNEYVGLRLVFTYPTDPLFAAMQDQLKLLS